MAITVTGPNLQVIPYDAFTFSGGEEHVKIKPQLVANDQNFTIHAALTSSADIVKLMMVTDALRRVTNCAVINLDIPYIPYARQDRVCNPGEALGIRVFCDLINSMNFDTVQVLMPHSDVALALLNNAVESVHNKSWDYFVKNHIRPSDHDKLVIVSPDAGAMKRTLKFAQFYNQITAIEPYGGQTVPVIMADKVRDVTNGNITSTTVHAGREQLEGKTCLIYDDICDGGFTFIKLAEELRKRGALRVILAVPHGIFSKGFGEIAEVINQVITTNMFDENFPATVPVELDVKKVKI